MKKLLVILLSVIFIGELYCQESKMFAPRKGDWGISTDASNIINIINGFPVGAMNGKYLLSDKFAIVGGLSFAGYSFPEYIDSHKVNAASIKIGGQYFSNDKKRIRPFAGFIISYGIGAEKEEGEDASNLEIFSFPFYAYVGIGAECFLVQNISLSTDFGIGFACTTERIFAMTENGDYTVPDTAWLFCYATGMGGLGGRLALNIYF